MKSSFCKKLFQNFSLVALIVLNAISCATKKADEVELAGRSPDEIRNSGVLRIGVRGDIPKFAYIDEKTGLLSGYEVAIGKRLAQELLGDANKSEFYIITPDTQLEMLNKNGIDLLIATFGKADEHSETTNLSSTYYIDSVSLLVKKDSVLTSLSDFSGREIGIVKDSSEGISLRSAAEEIGVQAIYREFDNLEGIMASLEAGAIDAAASSKSKLVRFVKDTMFFVPEMIAPREFSIASKLSNTALAAYVEQRLLRWTQEGILTNMAGMFGL
jgi:putative glutamine transport system substrate-binding protein